MSFLPGAGGECDSKLFVHENICLGRGQLEMHLGRFFFFLLLGICFSKSIYFSLSFSPIKKGKEVRLINNFAVSWITFIHILCMCCTYLYIL